MGSPWLRATSSTSRPRASPISTHLSLPRESSIQRKRTFSYGVAPRCLPLVSAGLSCSHISTAQLTPSLSLGCGHDPDPCMCGPAEQHGSRQCRGGRHRRTPRSRDGTCTRWGKMTRWTADDAAVPLGCSVWLHLLRVHLHTQIRSICCTAVPEPDVSMPVGELPHLPPLS